MSKARFPRRKVVSAFKESTNGASGNWFRCTLACGHSLSANGICPKGSFTPVAPKTCECRQCAKEQKQPINQ